MSNRGFARPVSFQVGKMDMGNEIDQISADSTIWAFKFPIAQRIKKVERFRFGLMERAGSHPFPALSFQSNTQSPRSDHRPEFLTRIKKIWLR